MLNEALFSAMGDIDEHYIELSERETTPVKLSSKRLLLIAAVFVAAVILTCTVALAATGRLNGLIDWFNGIWNYSTGENLSAMQVQALEGMTVPIGQSATSNEITVTAESAVIGESKVQILFTVSGPAGMFTDDLKYTFADFEAKLVPNPIGEGGPPANSFGIVSSAVDSKQNTGTFILNYSATVPPGQSLEDGGYEMAIELRQLIGIDQSGQVLSKYSGEDVHNGGAVTVYDGDWSFQFELPAVGSQTINLGHATVGADVSEIRPGEVSYGKTESIELHDIAVTSSGISYWYSYPEVKKYSIHIFVKARLKDGTIVSQGGGSKYLDMDGVTWHESFSWLVPVGLDNLDSIQIGDVTIPVAG